MVDGGIACEAAVDGPAVLARAVDAFRRFVIAAKTPSSSADPNRSIIAYWIAFGPHGPRALAPPDETKKVILYTLLGVAVAGGLFAFTRIFAGGEPKTMTKEYQEASEEFLKVPFPPESGSFDGELTHCKTGTRFRAYYRLQGYAHPEQAGSQGVNPPWIVPRYSGLCSTQQSNFLLSPYVRIVRGAAARLAGWSPVWCRAGTANSHAAVQKIEEALLDTIDPTGFRARLTHPPSAHQLLNERRDNIQSECSSP